MMLRSLLVVSSLLLTLPAQERRGQQPAVVPAKPASPELSGDMELGDDGQPRTINGKVVKLSPDKVAANNRRSGASSFCQFRVDTRPAKLMPGQTGTLIVTAIMKGQAVLPSPAPLEVTSGAQQGKVTIGAPTFQPAGLGRLAKAYIGRPVYDNYAMIEMPVALAADAVVGQKYNVSVEMSFDLFDGSSAQTIGKFVDRAVGTVECGQSLDPAVRGGYTPPANATARDHGNGAAAAATPIGTEPPVEALGAANAVMPEAAAGQAAPAIDTEAGATPRVAEDDNGFLILLAAGGALLAAVLLLVFKRK